ncbi:hypothetical protein WM34_27120 [Burkholderia ubonensis]|nr:hypothetical protein WM34_27120 [Burkholderia ubonensis]
MVIADVVADVVGATRIEPLIGGVVIVDHSRVQFLRKDARKSLTICVSAIPAQSLSRRKNLNFLRDKHRQCGGHIGSVRWG